MHSVDETTKRFKKYTEFTDASQLNIVKYPFNLIDNLEVNVISTKKIIDNLIIESKQSKKNDQENKQKDGALDEDRVEVYIY